MDYNVAGIGVVALKERSDKRELPSKIIISIGLQ
jgi:hypothetical protein